jgi:hypothetical protein
VDDASTVLGENVKSKPALYSTFIDSVYSTCFRRISDFDSTGDGVRYNPVPLYSQLQAWNKNQSLIWLASEDILMSPSYRKLKHLAMGGANVRWDPLNDSCMYYSNQISIQAGKTWQKRSAFMKVNVYTDHRDTIRVFPEYPGGLEISGEQEDLSRDGKFVVLEGYKAQSGDQANDSSEVFVLRVTDGRKGTVRSGNSSTACGGVDDMLMSPSGSYALIHWGSGGCGLDCGIAAYDTAMNYVGAVMKGHGHFDTTVDKNGREWVVAFSTGSDCSPSTAHIVKYRIPDGYDKFIAQGSVENDTTITKLAVWSDLIGGGHISGRAFDTGFVIASADVDYTKLSHPALHTAAFSQEIIKIYLDSTVGSPHLERLADAKSDAWYAAAAGCVIPAGGYWAQPHATVSRDGTKVLWGSTWNATSGPCASEAYVMDISNKARNDRFVNQTVNTWRRLTPQKVHNADGTGFGAADTNVAYHDFSQAVFAPEYGGVFYYGGGGHHGRQGNDVWFFNTADTSWTQVTAADSVVQSSYPSDGQNGSFSIRSFQNINMQCPSCVDAPGGAYWSRGHDPTRHGASDIPSAWRPWGSVKGTQRPWTSHSYQQMSWDTRSRIYQTWGPNTLVAYDRNSFIPPDSAGQPETYFGYRSKNTFRFDPYSKTWSCVNDTMPDLYAGNGSSAYDPINRVTLALNYDCAHTPGYGGLCGQAVWLQDTTGTWVQKSNPPAFCSAGQDTFTLYGNIAMYDRYHRKFLVWSGQGTARNCTGDNSVVQNNIRMRLYDPATNTWTKPIQLPDSLGNGYPNSGDANAAYSIKDHKVLVHGFQANFGTWVPTWSYDVGNGRWHKENPTPEVKLDGVSLSDQIQPLTYDPTNNVFLMIRKKEGAATLGQSGSGNQRDVYGSVGELWVYKLSSGDGRLFDPITPGAPSACSSPGL